jgi:membrane-bound lytic murein transglycosylase D
LPAGTAGKFQTAVASIPTDKRVWWRYHKVQAGETLASISRTYRIASKSIAAANNLDDDTLAPETRLIIPITPGKEKDSDTSTYAHAITHYKVRKGDTVESVAENFGVSAKMLRGWNHLKGSSLAGRKVLYLHLPVTRGAGETQVATKHSSRIHHKAGTETASASAPGHSTANHSTANRSAANHPTANRATASHPTTAHATLKHHKVKPGETLYSIANSYNTTVTALKHDNRNIAALRPGMILVIRDVR